MTPLEFFHELADRALKHGLEMYDHSVEFAQYSPIILGLRADFRDTARQCGFVVFDADLMDESGMDEAAREQLIDRELENLAAKLRGGFLVSREDFYRKGRW